MVRNTTIRDKRLSWRARGILAYVLSMPDDWHCTSDELTDEGTEGRDAVRTALTELERYGYLTRQRFQDKRGQWRTDAVIDECPTPENPSSVRTARSRKPAGRADDGKPGIGSSGAKNLKNNTRKNNTKNEHSHGDAADEQQPDQQLALVTASGDGAHASADAVAALFDEWWSEYPRKIGKKPALAAFRRVVRELGGIRKAEPVLISGTNPWLTHWSRERTPKHLIPHPTTWLNRGDYEAEPVPTEDPRRNAR